MKPTIGRPHARLGELITVGVASGAALAAGYAAVGPVQHLFRRHVTADELGIAVPVGTRVTLPTYDLLGHRLPESAAGMILVAMPSCDSCSALTVRTESLAESAGGLPIVLVYPDRHSLPKGHPRQSLVVDTLPSFLPDAMRVFKPQYVILDGRGVVRESGLGAAAINDNLARGAR